MAKTYPHFILNLNELKFRQDIEESLFYSQTCLKRIPLYNKSLFIKDSLMFNINE